MIEMERAVFEMKSAVLFRILGIHGRQVFEDNNPDTRMGLHHGFVNLWDNNGD